MRAGRPPKYLNRVHMDVVDAKAIEGWEAADFDDALAALEWETRKRVYHGETRPLKYLGLAGLGPPMEVAQRKRDEQAPPPRGPTIAVVRELPARRNSPEERERIAAASASFLAKLSRVEAELEKLSCVEAERELLGS